MGVKVVNKETGDVLTGKFAVLKEGNVLLYSGVRQLKSGSFSGCGKRQVLSAAVVTVDADDPATEMRDF